MATAQTFFRRQVEMAREDYETRTASHFEGVKNGTETTADTDWAAARINDICLRGQYVRNADGMNLMGKCLIPSEQHPRGERFMYQAVVEGGEIALLFWSFDRFGHTRRLLVTAEGRHFLEVAPHRAIFHTGKYSAVTTTILARLLYTGLPQMLENDSSWKEFFKTEVI